MADFDGSDVFGPEEADHGLHEPSPGSLEEIRQKQNGGLEPDRRKSETLGSFMKRDFPPRSLLLAPWLPEKGLAMIFAPRGIGKTFFALDIAYAVATGSGLLGWTCEEPAPVLWIDGEMPASTLQERLADIIARNDKEPPDPNFFRILAYDTLEGAGPDISTEQGQIELKPELEGVKLVIVDNLSSIVRSGKENEAESWVSIQEWALAQRRAGRTVLFVHHAGKGGDQRGTSKREDVLDTSIKLSRPSDYNPIDGACFNVEFSKARGVFGPDAEPFEAKLTEDGWARRELADLRDQRIVELSADGLTQRGIATELGIGLATVNRVLKRERGAL